ncbi:hypothetical protein FD723_41185 (plasmid) [Nostoc sp. C052]|uniref:hypothetical protein n=1 Tax=Nostoc sp. C052 TaxID=2576902 RepID=UPI0015C356EC|nr:hypothetical protein [Nostoc sp. C052]QLE46605.1 hypothetical protein FD723_41090 [Nostoc sp. C052]QLE46624.1 hypothetical protein FD723_41185 [Nostoc sp. C052]
MPVKRRGNVVVSLGHWTRGEALAPLAIAYGGILLAKVLQTQGQKCYNSKPQLQIEGLSLRNT